MTGKTNIIFPNIVNHELLSPFKNDAGPSQKYWILPHSFCLKDIEYDFSNEIPLRLKKYVRKHQLKLNLFFSE